MTPAAFRIRFLAGELLLAARAGDIAGLVRVADATAAKLLAALDNGAAGVRVPRVSSAAKARDVVAARRYRGCRRGFSNSPRAGGYGRLGVWEHVDAAESSVTVVARIEDPEAIEAIEAIDAIAAAARRTGKPACIMVAEAKEAADWRTRRQRLHRRLGSGLHAAGGCARRILRARCGGDVIGRAA